MKQLLAPANATFSASGKTITFATTIPSTISHILHVTNVTRGVLYFQPQAGSAYTGTYVSPVLTLLCSTSGHADADKLEIFYDDALTTRAVTASSLPLPTGAATETTLGGVLTTSDFDTKTGSLTETAPATDTASSGVNGRLQRIAQRITSLISALGSPFQAGGSIGNTSFASTVADGADVTLGAKADAKSTATDTTPVSGISVLKQISASVQAPPSQAVTNAGTFAVQSTLAAGATAIAKAEDVASADADVGVPAMAIRKATPANTSGTDGDYEMLQMSAGRVWASATIDAALPAGSNAIGKLAANSGVTVGAVEVAAAQTLATVTTVSTVTNLSQLGGTTVAMNTGTRSAGTQRVTIATDDVVPVSDNSGSLTVDNAGTFAVQGTTNTVPAATTMQNAATGNANGSSLNVSGYSTSILNITASVGMSGGTTINFEGSVDDSTWVALMANSVGAASMATTTTATGDWELNVAGYKSVRARISAYSAGTITVKGYSIAGAGAGNSVIIAQQPGANLNANSQVTASNVAATLAVARSTRRRLLAKNTDAVITVYVGAATVSSVNGMPLLAGESCEFRSQILYQVIAASGSPVVAIVDEYD